MSKTRKDTKDKKENKDKENNTLRVYNAIKSLGKEATLRLLFPKLEKRFTQEEVIISLNDLESRGLIQIQQKGIIKILKEKTQVTSLRNAKFFFGTADVTKSGAAFVAVEGIDKDVYIPNKYVKNAMPGDEVKIRITSHTKRPEGEIVAIIKRAQDSFTGRIDILEKFAFFIADERRLSTDVFVPLDALNGAKHKDRVIVRIMDWNTGGRNPLGEVVEVMSDKHSSDTDMKMILIGNGFSIDFPKDVYAELDKYTDEVPKSEIAKRVDMRKVLTFTIDPEDAKDFDDAISIRKLESGNYEVGVHIADVSHYVREGSQLDKEAEKRATSVYLPDRVCPMLPEKLSNVLCSLRPNEDKLTFSTIFEIDEKLNVKHFAIAKTIIHSDRRFSYEQAQEVLETGQGDHAEELKLLNLMAKNLRAKRMKKGAIAFEKAEVRFKLDETGKPLGVVLKIRKDAHLLVEDFMLLANETVARFGSRLKKDKKTTSAFVYRVHDKPDPAKLEMFSAVAARFGYQISFQDPREAATTFNSLLKKVEGKPEQNVLETMAIRSMAKAEYTTNNIGHYGLAMEYYTHFTSPIRRYPDVLVHRLLDGILTESD
ncbi:MAG: ribonuclease, partial [Bacteroidota bacterium]|nr:ribonuclease [Bacteroidota bacterium]